MTILHCDFETRSTLDLKEVGLDNYAKHPTTDVWCMGWAAGDHPTKIALPKDFRNWQSMGVFEHTETGGTVVAHNAPFELAIWNNIMVPRYGWPELKPEQCVCTMAMAYAMSLPGALDNAAAAVGLAAQKDQAGRRLMLQMCRPRAIEGPRDPSGQDAWEPEKIKWWDDEERLQKLYAYCKNDVEVERQLYKRLVPLSEKERRIWQLDYQINNRGVAVDIPTIQKAIEVVRHEQDRLNTDIRAATGNFVGFVTEVARTTQWVRSQGVDIPGLAKADVLDALELDGLPDHVRTVLQIRQEAGRSSTSKLRAFVDAASSDGRVRNTMQYHGAGTGRWAGRRIQPHNLPRPTMAQADIDAAIELLQDGSRDEIDLLYGPPMDVVANCLRGMIVAAPGHELLVGDFSNVEGRVIAWLAGEEWKLQAFRDQDAKTGPEIYLVAAGRIYNKPPTAYTKKSPERQTGKVSELAFGFQGALGAFRTMEKSLGLRLGLSDDKINEVTRAWRNAHPEIVGYWYALDTATMQAIRQPGAIKTAGAKQRQVKYRVAGSFLWCQLPSGRVLCYPYPKIGKQVFAEFKSPKGVFKMTFAALTEYDAAVAPEKYAQKNKLELRSVGEPSDVLTYMTVVSDGAKEKVVPDPAASGKWQRVATYGGKLAENVTQAVARDLLAEALIRLDEQGFPVVMHVHDEAVCELPWDAPEGQLQMLEQIMAEVPEWATGLPVAVEAWRGRRYRK
jgi:DNA polymerase